MPRRKKDVDDRPPLNLLVDEGSVAVTEQEITALVWAYMLGEGLDDPREVPEEVVHELLHWAFGARLMAAMVDLLIEGKAMVRRNPSKVGGAWEFRRTGPPSGEPVN
jgi:hypothetical protein